MSDAPDVVESTVARKAIGFVNLDISMLEVDLNKTVQLRIGSPFDETWLWTVHLEVSL